MRLTPSIVLLRTQTDERLTVLAREGSEPAFTALVERYRRPVLPACMRVLPEARAEDATQQVFVAAWKALNRGDDVRDVRPWLLRIARNTALNALRTPGYEYDELAESLQGGSAPPAELERRDVMRQTLAGLAALPDNQREALLRSAVQGAAHADIARDLGISEGATRQLVLRARASMRSAVTAVTPFPFVSWLASGSGAGVSEIAAGGGAAGGAALLAKAGAVVVLAGGAVATPALVAKGDSEKPAHRSHSSTRSAGPSATPDRDDTVAAATRTPRARSRVTVRATAEPGATSTPHRAARPHRQRPTVTTPARATATPVPTATAEPDDDHSGSSNSGKGGGSSGDDNSGSSNSGKDGGDDDDDVATVVPTVAATASPVPTVNPNSGSGDSGSGKGKGKGGGDDGGSDDHGGPGGGSDDD